MFNISKTKSNLKIQKTNKPVVLQVVPELDVPGGTERSTIEIAQALEKNQWDTLVASAGGRLIHQLNDYQNTHKLLPLKSKNPIQIRKNARSLAELIRTQNVNIIHARSRAPAWSAWYAARKTGCHFVTTFHGTYNIANNLKKRYNSIMTRGERVIANSHFIADHIVSNYSIDKERIRIIYRGVDVQKYNPKSVTQARIIQVMSPWRLPDGKSVIMLPGRLTEWKGHSLLLESLTHLNRDDYALIFVGDAQGREEYRRKLEKQVMERGLGHVVRFGGPCSDMPAAYMSADVVVNASTRPEAFGRVIVEAQAMGRPVVAFDHGGARETILDGDTGLLVEPANVSALAKALDSALSLNSNRRASLSKLSIEHINKNFTLDKMCNSTLDVYREILHDKSA